MTWQWDPTLFEGAAPHYSAGRLPYPPGLEAALTDVLGLDGTGTLLDVGCGPGTVALRLAARFGRVVGVDPDPGMLAEAARLAGEAGIANATWILARGEDLGAEGARRPLEPGTVRAATFAASFHWMDRDLVAAIVHDLLEPGRGAFVHVGPTQPHGFPRTDLPHDQIDDLLVRYLGSTRRAGQGTRLTSPSDEDAVLARLPFDGPQRLIVPGRPLQRSVDDVVHYVLSMSNAAPHLFGDRLDDFEVDLRRVLAGQETYVIDPGDTLLRIWRRRAGNSPPMADDRTDRIDRRAAHLLPEEDAAGGSARPRAQAEAILEDSDARQEDRDAAPDSVVEHRTSDEATPPV